jgi:hypothetical protein
MFPVVKFCAAKLEKGILLLKKANASFSSQEGPRYSINKLVVAVLCCQSM